MIPSPPSSPVCLGAAPSLVSIGLRGVYITGSLDPGDACASSFPYTASIFSQAPHRSLRWTLGAFAREAANGSLHSVHDLEERLQLLLTQWFPVSPPGQVSLQKSSVLGDVLGQNTFSGHWQLGCSRFCRETIISPPVISVGPH